MENFKNNLFCIDFFIQFFFIKNTVCVWMNAPNSSVLIKIHISVDGDSKLVNMNAVNAEAFFFVCVSNQ